MGSPQIFNLWESGGIDRLNDDMVVGLCDSIAERDCNQFVPLSAYMPPILAFTPYTLHPTPKETSICSSLFHSFTLSRINVY